ncbi:MAG: alkaline phosphatase family protein, partial [Rhodanobacter sp.]
GILAGFNPKSDSVEALADFARVEQTLEQPHPHMQCWDKNRVPARLAYGHNARVPQVLCLANVHWRISTRAYVAKRKGRLSLGEHGFDNAEPQMQALFVAHGPAFRRGAKLAAFPNVDVYPLMTHLLGIPAQPNDGNASAVQSMLIPAVH